MLNRKKSIGIVILIILITLGSYAIYSSSGDDFDPRIDSWYEVEDWEVEVCSRWGGGGEPQSFSGSGIDAEAIISSAEIVTLQGRKMPYGNGDGVIYEASWYYQPAVGQESYTVYFVKGNNKKEILSDTSTAQMGDGNYHAEDFDTDPGYTHVLIEYGSKSMQVEIVEDTMEAEG